MGRFFRRAVGAAWVALAAGSFPAAPPALADEIVPWDRLVGMLAGSRGVAVLPTIAFEFDSDRLTPASEAQVEQLAKALRLPAFERSAFSIDGHTDGVGSAAYNRDLSLRRARRVMRRLVEDHGIPAGMLTARGLGESAPRAGLAPDDGGNRRVEIVNVTSAPAAGDGGEDAGARLAPVSPPAPAGGEAGRAPGKRALLIGIDAYRQVSPLDGPVADARAMRSFLVERAGYRPGAVRMLVDSEATRAGILAAAHDWLVAGTRPGDEAFLYFSGHGFQQLDGADGDEDDGMDETLVPVDASIDADNRVHGLIADDEIAALLDELAGRRVRVVVDACHSGTTERGGDADWRFVKSPRRPDGAPLAFARTRGLRREAGAALADGRGGVTVWTAVQAHQKALVDREAAPGGAGSVFTRRLLAGAGDGLADSDGDGRVTAAELLRYITAESESYCARYPGDCPYGLTPQLVAAEEERARPALGVGEAAAGTAALVKDLILEPARERQGAAAGAGGLTLRLPAGARFRYGDEIDLLVESDRDGALVLLDIDADGQLVQIFPNDFTRAGREGRIRAGRALAVPGPDAGFRFRAAPPAGSGLLVAVLSDGNARLAGVVSRRKDLSVVPRPRSYVADLGAALGANGDGAWSVAAVAYEIVAP